MVLLCHTEPGASPPERKSLNGSHSLSAPCVFSCAGHARTLDAPRWSPFSCTRLSFVCGPYLLFMKKVVCLILSVTLQHHQHQATQALHLAGPQQQSAIYHAGLAPTPPSMTPASNTQSPQNSFPAAQQTVFTIHPSHVQPAYTNPPHMAHVPQVNQL